MCFPRKALIISANCCLPITELSEPQSLHHKVGKKKKKKTIRAIITALELEILFSSWASENKGKRTRSPPLMLPCRPTENIYLGHFTKWWSTYPLMCKITLSGWAEIDQNGSGGSLTGRIFLHTDMLAVGFLIWPVTFKSPWMCFF